MHLIIEDSCSREEGLSYHSLRSKKLDLLLLWTSLWDCLKLFWGRGADCWISPALLPFVCLHMGGKENTALTC